MRQTNAVHLFLRDTPGKRLPCLHVQAFAGQRTANGFAVELAAIRPASGCHACMSRSSLRYGPCWTRATGTQHHLPGNGQRTAARSIAALPKHCGGNRIMITSTSNGQIKKIQQLLKKSRTRKEEGLFVAEGIKMFREAPPERIEKIYLGASFAEKGTWREILREKGLEEKAESLTEVVEDKVFKSLSDTVTPQGVLCLIRIKESTLEEMIPEEKPALLMILEDLQDPGNLGTILRTGEGAGITGVILSKNSVDIYNPKVIRSTMGSVYRVPFCYTSSIQEEILPWLREKKITGYAAHLEGKNSYDQEDYTKATAFFIGNEGNGLSRELSQKADIWIRIPMEGQVESLNAAMASGILMYEAYRQRRNL